MKKRLLVKLALAGCQIAAVGALFGQVPDPTKPDRGIAPMVAYAASEFETINPATGNLVYDFPIAKLAPGRGGFSAGLSLTYNSTIFDVDLSTYQETPLIVEANLVPSYTGGGWHYSYQYGLWEEGIPLKDCSATTAANVRVSVVSPDGGHHTLQLYNGQSSNDEDGGSFYNPGGQLACPGVSGHSAITTGNLTWYTTDGTFIKVVTQAVPFPGDWTTYLWWMYLPDGTYASGFGSQANSILDRNGNIIWFNNIDPNTNDSNLATLIGDNFGHVIHFQHYTSWEDVITAQGYSGNPATWTVTWSTTSISSSNKYTCLKPDTQYQLCTPNSLVLNGLNTPIVTSITAGAPANLTYSFLYDDQSAPGGLGWGELRQVILPASGGETAATVTYAYTLPQGETRGYDELSNAVSRKEVDWQEKYDGQSAAGTPDVWTYSCGLPCGNNSPLVTAPDGGQTQYFYPTGTLGQGLAYKIFYPGAIEVDRTWYQNVPYKGSAGGTAPINPYIQTETKIVGGQSTTTTYSVDTNGNQTSASVVWNGTTIRSTAAAFNLCGAPSGGWCAADGGNGTPAADDSHAYWNASAPWLRNLLTRKVVTDYTPTSNPTGTVDEYQYSSTGDLTEERHWNSAAPNQPATSNSVPQPLTATNAVIIDRTFNAANLTDVTDGRQIHTHYTYDSSNLYPTQKTVGGVAQEYYAFDSISGLLSNKTDGNQVRDCRSYDVFNRLVQLSAGCNTSPWLTTTAAYEDTNRRTIDTDGGGRVSITEYDQLHRVALSRQLENPATQGVDDSTAGIKVQTRYKNLSANSQGFRLVSNPYRAATSSAASSESTMGWTVTTLDTAGRPTQAQAFSGSALPYPWGSSPNGAVATTYTYNGYTTTVQDPAGVTRATTTDGLGRIVQVVEKGIGPNGADATTTYTYDGLDNLIGVNQSGQIRSFTYDSLGRLTKAVNGESGITCYTYDNDGNLSTRIQAANSTCTPAVGILTSYNYDYLNRLTSKVMPEGTVTYTYDQGTYGLGRLYSVSYGNTTTTYNVHDQFGRVTSHTQTVDGVPYTFGYAYNGSNNLTSITYPSGRQAVLTYDTAGRVGQVESNGIANAGSVTYAPHGVVAAFQMGNGLWETTNYNSRLQTAQISLGSQAQTTGPGVPAASEDQWWLSNNYGSTSNNGNVLQQTIGLPGSIQISEAYSYDKANRVLVASEQSSNPTNPPCPDSGARYVEGFQYDVWGNRSVPCLTGLGTSTLAPWSFDSNNRITSTGWVYDSTGRGNIAQEPYVAGYRMYLYDSENRQIAFCTQDPGGCVNTDGAGRTRYLYDGDGRRVEKRDSTGVTVYVYDIQGNLAAEYSTETAAAGSATEYLTADHLGTPRVVTAGTPGAATVVARRDYRPFGEEIVPSTGDPRLNVAGYSTDTGTTIKFTGKERDAETGLDYFQARYMSSAQGRFTSPDPGNTGAVLTLPQTWNGYAYVVNSPLRFVDPTGLCSQDGGGYYDDDDHETFLFSGSCSKGQIGGSDPDSASANATITPLPTAEEFLTQTGHDYSEEEVQAFLEVVWDQVTAGQLQGLLNIVNNSGSFESIAPYDFHYLPGLQISHFTRCGTPMDAAQFANYVAGFQGAVYDNYYTLQPNVAQNAVETMGVYFHSTGETTAQNDRFDRTGLPMIEAGERGGRAFIRGSKPLSCQAELRGN